MNIVRIIFLTTFAFIMFACATTDSDKDKPDTPVVTSDAKPAVVSISAEQKATFQSALENAKAAYAKADEVGYAWRDTEKMMKKAEEAIQAGEFDKAMKLVAKANKQAESAYAQFENEKNAGPRE